MKPAARFHHINDHFSLMEDAFFREMEAAFADEKQIDGLLDRLFPSENRSA